MKRSSVAHLNCSMARALDIVGEWWTLLVLRDVFFGLRRFDAIQADLGIARNVLADRLSTLLDHGILERRRYQASPERFEYVLTPKGEDLFGVLMALMRWGDTWASPDGPPLAIEHKVCGAMTAPGQVCSSCGGELRSREIRMRKGPGFRPVGTLSSATA